MSLKNRANVSGIDFIRSHLQFSAREQLNRTAALFHSHDMWSGSSFGLLGRHHVETAAEQPAGLSCRGKILLTAGQHEAFRATHAALSSQCSLSGSTGTKTNRVRRLRLLLN